MTHTRSFFSSVGPVRFAPMAAVVLALTTAACGDEPIAPTDSRWAVPTLEARMSMAVDQDSIEWVDNVAHFTSDGVAWRVERDHHEPTEIVIFVDDVATAAFELAWNGSIINAVRFSDPQSGEWMDFDGDGGFVDRSSLREAGCEPSHQDPECPEPESGGGELALMGGCDHLCQAAEVFLGAGIGMGGVGLAVFKIPGGQKVGGALFLGAATSFAAGAGVGGMCWLCERAS